jgi:hypothetical protein
MKAQRTAMSAGRPVGEENRGHGCPQLRFRWDHSQTRRCVLSSQVRAQAALDSPFSLPTLRHDHFLMLTTAPRLNVIDLEQQAGIHATLSEFGRPFDQRHRIGLCSSGLRYACSYAEHCLGWIWHQWLMGTPHESIREQVALFVERGLHLRKEARSYEKLPHHDLLLLHCAIFASDLRQLNEVVGTIADASGDKGERPFDVGGLYAVAVGELYAAAWCGMMKYSILGDATKATEQFNIIWEAQRDQEFIAAPKALAAAWLKKDWKAFVRHQQKDFERLWTRARKHGLGVKSENSREIVVATSNYRIGHMWCWSHCGLALLAHRQGIEVATDPLWFPPHALE